MNKKIITKKKVKPAYIVDMTNCENEDDLRMEFIYAKSENGVPLNKGDIGFVILRTAYANMAAWGMLDKLTDRMLNAICGCAECEICTKKKPWYKRLWNKLKYAFTW